MLYEYAVEPEAIAVDWETFRYVIEKFGFDRGRLISGFPNNWARRVADAARDSNMGPVKLSSLVNRLRKAQIRAIIPNNRRVDAGIGDWLESALAQHGERPFRAIVVGEDGTRHPAVLEIDDLTDEHDLFAASISWEVERTDEGIAAAVAPLLCSANEVLIVDPYFDLSERKFKGPLKVMMQKMVRSGKTGSGIQIHFRAHRDRPSMEDVEREVSGWIRGLIPNEFWLELYGWEERDFGEDFHDRFLLCNRGGMEVGAGFAYAGHHQKLGIRLLSFDDCEVKRSRFKLETAVYDLTQPVLRIESDGRVTRI